MSDADRVGDELHSRMRQLARGAEQTAAPGLADVRRRRARRQRNTTLGAAVAVVGVVGGAALVLQPLGENPRVEPLGPGLTASQTASTGRTAPATSTGAPSTVSTSSATSTSAENTSTSPEEPPDELLTLDLGSLVLPAELEDAGIALQSGVQGDADGQPTLPPMCAAGSWQEEHSFPTDRVSGGYGIDGGELVFDLLAYPSATAANAALVKLKEDARACPVVNEFLTVEVTAVGSAVGDEFVVFALDAESGQDGSIERIWVTVARVDNVLVAATVDRQEGFAGDTSGDEQLSRTAAQANVDHLLAG